MLLDRGGIPSFLCDICYQLDAFHVNQRLPPSSVGTDGWVFWTGAPVSVVFLHTIWLDHANHSTKIPLCHAKTTEKTYPARPKVVSNCTLFHSKTLTKKASTKHSKRFLQKSQQQQLLVVVVVIVWRVGRRAPFLSQEPLVSPQKQRKAEKAQKIPQKKPRILL